MSTLTEDPGLAAGDRRKATYEAPGTKVGDLCFSRSHLVAEGGSADLLDRAMAGALGPFIALRVECAPVDGQIGGRALTGSPGFRRMEAHGSTSHPQHRVQA